MPFSTTYANNILNYIFAKVDKIEAPTTVFLGLSTNDPEKDGGVFNELSGDSYERLAVAQFNTSAKAPADYPNHIGTASGREIKNLRQINWTKATTRNWDAVNGFGLFAQKEGGLPFYYGKLDLTAAQTRAGGLICEKGSVMLFDPGRLKITFPSRDSISGSILYAINSIGEFENNDTYGAYEYSMGKAPFTIQDGVEYTVVWDGGEYFCTSFSDTLGDIAYAMIGNTKYTSDAVTEVERDSGEPFTIFYNDEDSSLMILADTEDVTHSIAVYKVG